MKLEPIDWNKMRQFLETVADELHPLISPAAMKAKDGVLQQTGNSGDLVSILDEVAEREITRILRERSPYPCALINEGTAQLIELHPNPHVGYVFDPIDGTRPALMGIPLYCVCAAAYDLAAEPILANVKVGVIDSMIDERFSFQRGHGVWRNGQPWKMPARPQPQPGDLRIHYDYAGGVPALAMQYVAPFSQSYLQGFMVLNSCSIATIQLLTGGIHSYVHVGARLRAKWPALDPIPRSMKPDVNGMKIWDIAATAPLLWEAGMCATRSDGASLEHAPLNDKPPLQGYDVIYTGDSATQELFVDQLGHQEKLLLADQEAVTQQMLRVYGHGT